MATQRLDNRYRRLFAAMRSAWVAAPPPPPVRIDEIDLETAAAVDASVVIYGWTARILRTAQAVLLLDSEGYAAETSPLIRSMIEHTIALAWLEEHRGDALQALIRKRAYSADRLRAAEGGGWKLSDEVHNFLDDILALETSANTRPLDRLLHVAQQATEYGLGTLYQAWLIESDTSHPSIASSLAYFEPIQEPGQESIQLRSEPRDLGTERPAGVALITYMALQAYNRVLAAEDLGTHLSQWHDELEELNAHLAEEHGSQSS